MVVSTDAAVHDVDATSRQFFSNNLVAWTPSADGVQVISSEPKAETSKGVLKLTISLGSRVSPLGVLPSAPKPVPSPLFFVVKDPDPVKPIVEVRN